MLDGAAEDEEPIKQSDVLVEDPEEIKKHAKKLEKFFVKILKQKLERGLKQGKLLIKLPEELELFVIKLPEVVAELFIENPERKVVELIIKSIVELPEALKLYLWLVAKKPTKLYLRLTPSRIAC